MGAAIVLASALAGPAGVAGEEGFGYRQVAGIAAGCAVLGPAGLVALRGPAVLVCVSLVLALSIGTLYVQYRELGRHDRTLEDDIGDPWRFRLLSEWVAEGCLRARRWGGRHTAGPRGVPRPSPAFRTSRSSGWPGGSTAASAPIGGSPRLALRSSRGR